MSVDLTTVLVGVALLFAAFVKGTSGMGFPLIATPMVALLLDLRVAITILIIPNIVMDIAQIFRGGFPYAVLRRFGWFFLLTVIGVFVVSSWLRCEFTISPRLEKILNPPAGFISGFINGLTNAAGPPLAIYLYSLRLEKREFIRSIATMFIVTKLSQLAAVSTWNLFNRSTLALSLEVTLFILLGFYGGLKIQDRINKETFSRWLLLLLFIVGVTLILRALTQAG